MVDKYRDHEQQIADDAFALFNGRTLQDLIEKYRTFETDIRARVLETVSELFCRRRFVYDKDSQTLRRGREIYAVFDSLESTTRSLYIYLRSIGKDVNTRNRELVITIPHAFGLIRYVHISVPEVRGVDYDVMSTLVQKRLEFLYLRFEHAVMRASEEVNRRHFVKLYDRIDHQLHAVGKSHLVDSYYLVVAYDNAFHYFFDASKARALITHLKQHQSHPFSPCELFAELLTTPLEFVHSLSSESWKSKRTVSKEWHQLTYTQEKLAYYLAEKAIYPAAGHAAHAICEVQGFVLGLATASDIQREIVTEVVKIDRSIEEVFRNGLKEYSTFFRVVSRFRSSFAPSHGGAFARFLGAFMAEFMKTIGQ